MDNRHKSLFQMILEWFTAPEKEKKNTAKSILTRILIVACAFILLAGLILTIFEAQKNSQQYQLAYNYLIASEEFAGLNVDESLVFMNSHSSHSKNCKNGDDVTRTEEFGFLVKFMSFTVVCHNENGVWRVCEKCTLFS